MRRFAVVLCLAALVSAEDAAPKESDPAAEELLKKVEEKLQTAKTVSIRASMAVRIGRYPVNREIALDFKEGNRARMTMTGADKVPLGTACDGKVRYTRTPDVVTKEDAAADFAQKARVMSLRVAIEDLSGYFAGSERSPLTYTEFAFLPDEKIGERTARVVKFTATRDSSQKAFRLWIDENSLEVLKREIVESISNVETREVLTFTSTTFDADIPDSTFVFDEPKEGDK